MGNITPTLSMSGSVRAFLKDLIISEKNRTQDLRCYCMKMQSLEERCNQILRNMESSLNARDRVGIQDFVLLDAHTSESAFLDNLRKRFHENLIYVSH